MSPKLYLETHGCQMNEYDSQKIFALMQEKHNFTLTKDPKEASLIVLNTCSIRDKAEEKVYSQVGRWHKIKKANNTVIAVGGCVASQEGANIRTRAPYVDIIFGPQTLHRLPQLFESYLATKKPVIDISFPEIEKFDYLPATKTTNSSSYISIMEGCNKYCSYCIVPYTRGTEINRPFDDILAEAASCIAAGAKELILLGQNVNDYQGKMHNGEIADLALLIHYIAAFDEIERIRFSTSHPSAFKQNLIDAYREEPKLVSHLHLPVQSGSDRILSAMKRDYTTLEFKSKIRKIRAARPGITISSDFIVGFPGETAADFEQTLKLIQDIGFDKSYSFIYSKRPGTPAANIIDNTSLDEKKERLRKLQHVINMQTDKISNNMLHTTQKILVTGISKKSTTELTGRTENNRVVNFPGDSSLIGVVVPINITAVFKNSLRGELS
jgi:tRNA-2-methylthio-N6-dimethylallyladenosine synthase